MQELENILEEIEQRKARAEKLIVKPPHDKLDQVANDTAETFIEAYKECQEIIRKYMNDGWIPVEERLPEDDVFVLVTVTGIYNALTFSSAIQLASYCKNDGWFIEGYPDWENPNVSAWRPLPEPYHAERSNDEKE